MSGWVSASLNVAREVRHRLWDGRNLERREERQRTSSELSILVAAFFGGRIATRLAADVCGLVFFRVQIATHRPLGSFSSDLKFSPFGRKRVNLYRLTEKFHGQFRSCQ